MTTASEVTTITFNGSKTVSSAQLHLLTAATCHASLNSIADATQLNEIADQTDSATSALQILAQLAARAEERDETITGHLVAEDFRFITAAGFKAALAMLAANSKDQLAWDMIAALNAFANASDNDGAAVDQATLDALN